MKTKKILTLSVLLLSQATIFSAETERHESGFNLSRFKNVAVGAAVGYGAGWGLERMGAHHITQQPGIKHLFQIATEQEKVILEKHLPELCALIGALTAQGKLDILLSITKVAAVIDLLARIRNQEFSKEDVAYMARDLALAFEEFVPEQYRTLPSFSRTRQ